MTPTLSASQHTQPHPAIISSLRPPFAVSYVLTCPALADLQGYYVPESWDVYWTIRQACHMAFKHMQPHQRVNCIPGISAMSLKRTFVSTWQEVRRQAGCKNKAVWIVAGHALCNTVLLGLL